MGILYQGNKQILGGGAGSLTELGVIASADELNYVDGVTSNIQTQLNDKASISDINVLLENVNASLEDVNNSISNNYTALSYSLAEKASTASYSGTFSASSWSGSAPYTQSITVNGILVTDNPFVDIDLSNISDWSAVTEAWGLVGRVTASDNNTITAYCYEEKPTVDIPIILKVVR